MKTETYSDNRHNATVKPLQYDDYVYAGGKSSLGLGPDAMRAYLNKIGAIDRFDAADEVDAAMDVEAGLYAESLLAAEAEEQYVPVAFSDEERGDLETMARHGKLSRNRLVEANLKLVIPIARKYSLTQKISFWDLVQEGNVGLVEAAQKYDYSMGLKFSTYATWCIRDAILKCLPQGRKLSMSRNTMDKMNKVKAASAKLYEALGRHATYEEIAKETKLSARNVRELVICGREPLSLDTPVEGTDDLVLGDAIYDGDTEWLGDDYATESMKKDLMELLAELDQEDREIIHDKFGFNEALETMSQQELKEKHGLTNGQLERRQQKIMAWFRTDDRVAEMIEYLR